MDIAAGGENRSFLAAVLVHFLPLGGHGTYHGYPSRRVRRRCRLYKDVCVFGIIAIRFYVRLRVSGSPCFRSNRARNDIYNRGCYYCFRNFSPGIYSRYLTPMDAILLCRNSGLWARHDNTHHTRLDHGYFPGAQGRSRYRLYLVLLCHGRCHRPLVGRSAL
ncbi:hypothetical protein ES703_94161 [subsurface metagenome]